jgi:hypothetical protein
MIFRKEQSSKELAVARNREWDSLRDELVQTQIASRGIKSPRVL